MTNGMDHKKIKAIEASLGLKVSEYWLNLLLGIDKHEIGVVKASGKLIQGELLEEIVNDYKVLDNKVGLTLPLVIGGGPQYDSLPAYKKAYKVNGIRVTNKELLDQIVPAAQQNLSSVVDALNNGGVEAVAIPLSVLRAKPHGFETDEKGNQIDTGFVGDVLYVDTAPIIEAIHKGKTPVISHIGTDDYDQLYNINATPAAAAVVKYLQAYKLILLGDLPILDKDNNVIPEFKSEAEVHKLIKEGVLKGGAALNAQNAYNLLKEMGPGRSVQITTVKNLPAELLTDGVGSILRMPFIIQSYSKPEHIGESNLIEMINDAFSSRGKVLTPGYFGHDSIDKIYVDAEKTGGAVVKNIDGAAYMCKIFTHPDYRGNGLATQIMDRINYDYQNGFIWRTSIKEDNKETKGFYKHFVEKFKESPMQKQGKVTDYIPVGDFMVFGVNMDSKAWDNLKYHVASLPKTMVQK